MRRKLLFGCLLICCGLLGCQKTVVEFAEEQSHLDLPADIKLTKYKNSDFSNGDILREIEFALNDNQLENLRVQCKKRGYKMLPMNKNLGFSSMPYKAGYYQFKYLSTSKDDYEYTILDCESKRLVLFHTED